MTTFRFSTMVIVTGAALLIAVEALGQITTTTDSRHQGSEASKRVIVVSLEDRKLALVEDGQVKKIYSVAVGKSSTPSPIGTFTIERRVANPTYHHGGKTVLPGPGNPVGTRWMGLSIHGYGIHGTNEPKSIGKAASHGCIRMARTDLEEFYESVEVGDSVELIGTRNGETAHLFGNEQNPAAAAAQPVLTATAATPAAPQVATSQGPAQEMSAIATASATPSMVEALPALR